MTSRSQDRRTAGALVAGFWLWQVRSIDEAVDWIRRAPFLGETEIEIRPILEAEYFAAEFTPEEREREDRLRKQDKAA